jgi:hypothetical protein
MRPGDFKSDGPSKLGNRTPLLSRFDPLILEISFSPGDDNGRRIEILSIGLNRDGREGCLNTFYFNLLTFNQLHLGIVFVCD